jgi:glycosyltransferase involved in cell wall biosynthesis
MMICRKQSCRGWTRTGRGTATVSEKPDQPLVSIVTPSYNMAPFLQQCIESVLSQDYPRIEYIVMDGGSTDGTLEILKRYEGRLHYESSPDKGQCDAINKGFLRSHGQIFAFLCADDAYLPGAVSTAVRHMQDNPGYAGIYGEGYLVDEQGTVLCPYPTREFDPELLKKDCFICQPASYLWREAFEESGMMDPELHHAVDYDLWARLFRRHRLRKVDEYLAVTRMHRGAKTLRDRSQMYRGAIQVLKRHYGYAPYNQVYGYCCSLVDKRDGFFEPVPPSAGKYLLSVAYGSFKNSRHLLRFWRECLTEGVGALRRGSWPLKNR